MLLKRFFDLGGSLIDKGHMYYSLGKDVFDYGKDLFRERFGNKKNSEEEDTGISVDFERLESERKNLEKKFTIPNSDSPEVRAHQQSMMASQGVPDKRNTGGSSYNGPGRPGGKFNSNMWQRNYDNHQGN